MNYSLARALGVHAVFRMLNRSLPVVVAYHGVYDGPERTDVPPTFIHIGRFKEQERVQLSHEALTEAIRQAVDKSVKKLNPPKGKRRRARRRR